MGVVRLLICGISDVIITTQGQNVLGIIRCGNPVKEACRFESKPSQSRSSGGLVDLVTYSDFLYEGTYGRYSSR